MSEVPKLKDLLKLDQADSNPLALPLVFGDSYLIRKNRIFRAIREKALSFGYSFSREKNDRYEALPFTYLEELIGEKKIPVIHNREAVEFVAGKVPDANWLDVADGFRRCFAFHEGCHAVARETLQPSPDAESSPEARVLRAMLEESFANTCELFAILDCESDQDLAIYEANSYTALWEVRDFISEIGLDPVAFLYVMLHYLRANFLASPDFTADDHKKILAVAEKVSGRKYTRENEELASLAEVAYTLDENFRQTTSRLHLRLLGLPTDLESRDPIAELSKAPELISRLTGLVKAIAADN